MAAVTQPIRTCAYTGKRYTLEPVVGQGWIPRGLLDPARMFKSEAEALFALNMRNGSAQKKPTYRCPYTARKYEVVKHPSQDAWYAPGIFTPVRVYPTMEAALYAISTRFGVKPAFPEHSQPVTAREVEPPPGPVTDANAGLGDAAAEKIDKMFAGR